MKLPRKILEGIAQATYGKSHDARADENQTEEFLDGYLVGQLQDQTASERIDAIVSEYQRRGCPESGINLANFKEWKRGYWSGRWEILDIPPSR